MPDHSTSLERLERAYEEWFRMHAGVNRATKPHGRWRNWLRGMRSIGFFPRTSIRRFAFRCASTEESLATDWAQVGADLYAAIQECKKQ